MRVAARSMRVARTAIDIAFRSLSLQIAIERARLAAAAGSPSPSSPSPSSTRSWQAASAADYNLPYLLQGVHAPAPLHMAENGTTALRGAGHGGMSGSSDDSASSSQGPDLRSSADYAGAAGSPMETLSMLKSASSAAAALQNVDSAQLANELLAATDQVQR